MTLTIRRTNGGESLFELEYWVEGDQLEIATSIHIREYTEYVQDYRDMVNWRLIANIFDELSDLRGWLWETFFVSKRNTPESYVEVLKELRHKLNQACSILPLIYVNED